MRWTVPDRLRVGSRRSSPPAPGWRDRPVPRIGRPPFATFTVDVPAGWNIQPLDHVALSPDSRYIAFTAAGPDHHGSLWLRPLTGSEARQVPGSEGAVAPFWSPDSTRVGFFAQRQPESDDARRRPRADAEWRSLPRCCGGAAAWTVGGDILFMPLGSALGTPVRAAGLRRLDSATGAVQPVAAPSTEPREYIDYLAPNAIPGTDAFTFVRWNPSTLEMTGHVGETGTSRIVDLGRTDSRIVVTASGHAVFVRNGTLVAQRFDIASRRLVGAPFPLAQDVAVYQPMLGHFSATSDLIVYVPRHAMTSGMHMTLVDRKGTPMRTIGEVAELQPSSCVCRRHAVGDRADAIRSRGHATSGCTISTERIPIRLTFDGHDDMAPPGRPMAVRSCSRRIDQGSVTSIEKMPTGRPGGRGLLVAGQQEPQRVVAGRSVCRLRYGRARLNRFAGRINKDLMTVSLDGKPRGTTACDDTGRRIHGGHLAGRHARRLPVDGSGRAEVFVETFPEKGGRWQVTTTGGVEPMWRADGRELFFVSSARRALCGGCDRSGGTMRFGPPRVLFTLQNLPNTFRRVRASA